MLLGTILPDIDCPTSLLGKYNIFSYAMDHRGFVHTIPGMALFVLPMFLLSNVAALGLMAGYLMHLIADTFNPAGIMLLYPIRKKHYNIANIKVGGAGEAALFLGGLLLLLT